MKTESRSATAEPLLRLREHGFARAAEGRESFDGHSVGWGEAATLIKFYVEHGVRYEQRYLQRH